MVEPANYFLEPGHIYAPDTPTNISAVLGSAVSVCLYDRKRKTGGMNLFQHPLTKDPRQATARYGNVAILVLLRMLREHGSKDRHIEAQILGGARSPDTSVKDVGMQNTQIARKILYREQIPIVSEDTGGRRGRKVVFRTDTSELMVMKVAQLRKSDWYPYPQGR
jgi:chemotaxis protein CheD